MLIEKPTGEIRTAYDRDNEPYLFEATGKEAKRFCDILRAEDEGRLVILPCKVGDTVYRLLYGKIWEGMVLNFCFDGTVSASIQNVTGGAIVFEHNEDFGKTVFLSREEAEAALKGETKDV